MISSQTQLSQHAKDVLAWREYLTTMNDESFLNLIRMYLGEIKTPYNKTNLIEDLSSFLRKEEHQKAICALLGENDIEILSAINFIPEPSQNKIAEFFDETFSTYEISQALSNFEERLLIFKTETNSTGKTKTIYKLNPLLEKTLQPFLSVKLLFGPNSFSPCTTDAIKIAQKTDFPLSPLFFASVACFVSTNPDLCKLNGEFKKKISTNLASFFPAIQDENFLLLVILAFKNLGILSQTDEEFSVNQARLQNFLALPAFQQIVYVCTSSAAHFTVSQLEKHCAQFIALLKNIPQNGFSQKSLFRLAYLIQEKYSQSQNSFASSRLSNLLSQSSTQNTDEAGDFVFFKIIENAELLGVLKNTEVLSNGEKIFCVNPIYTDVSGGLTAASNSIHNAQDYRSDQVGADFGASSGVAADFAASSGVAAESMPLISVDASFSLFVMNSYSLEKITSLFIASEFVQYDSVLKLEITKKSCMKYFSLGFSAQNLIDLLSANSQFSLPQNLVFQINEWFEQFNCAKIYHGFVLTVSENRQKIVENNTEFSKHIEKKLASGVYFLNFSTSEELNFAIEKSGLDFIADFSKGTKEIPLSRLKPISENENLHFDFSQTDNAQNQNSSQEIKKSILALSSELEKIEGTKEQKLALQERINKKIVICSEQLRAESVRTVKFEAYGMDYTGKIYIAEKAIEDGALIELVYDEKFSPNGIKATIVQPVALEKKTEGTFLLAKEHGEKNKGENSNQILHFSLAQAKSVRRLIAKNWDEK